MATLDEIAVVVRAETRNLEQGMRRVESIVRQSSGGMQSSLAGLTGAFRGLVPALSAAALVQFGRHAIDAAGRMNDLAGRIGFAASTLSALEPGLATNGASLEEFAASVNLMNANLGQAVSGNQELIKAFDRLGLSVNQLRQLTPEEQFYAITRALAQVGTQYEQTELARAIFGRGAAALIPIIKEANGDLDESVRRLKEAREALGKETIDRIDAFGDSLQIAGIKAKNAFLEVLAAILKVNDAITESIGSGPSGAFVGAKIGLTPRQADQAIIDEWKRATGPAVVGDEPFGPFLPKKDARGSNAALLKSSGGGGDGTSRKDLLPPDYDSGEFEKYVRTLEDEAEALGKSDRELAVRRALTEAQASAQKDFNDGLRDTPLLYEEESKKIESLAGDFLDLQKRIEDNRETAREWQRQLSDGLTDIILHFDSAKGAAKGFFEEIAR